ncbi:MAG: prolipoprotein diacylglyceryl transferase [Limnochordales bacterium]|nr:prolipoprotein diacylglyceryl transferase [Limnochordales bacterium]
MPSKLVQHGGISRLPVQTALVIIILAGFIYVLWLLFRGIWQVDPVLVRIGPVSIRWYGVMIALGVLTGYSLAERIGPRRGIAADHIFNLLLLVVPAGLIGARLAFVLQNLPYYLVEPTEILRTWQGGLSMHGAVLAALVVFIVYARLKGLSFASITDIAAPATLVGQAIGRWGNFFNQEVYGYPTDVPWKMYVRPENRPPDMQQIAYYHPAFLYESLWNMASALVVLWFIHQPHARRGDGLWLYFLLYSIGRFWVEFFRIGVPYWAGLTLAQLVSLGLIAVGLAGFLIPRLCTFRRIRGQAPGGR